MALLARLCESHVCGVLYWAQMVAGGRTTAAQLFKVLDSRRELLG